MTKLMFIYKDYLIKAECTKENTHIENSYQVRSIKDMKHILKKIRENTHYEYAIHNMSLFKQIIEWRGHNLLYVLGFMKDRTKSVDLNINEPWYRYILYTIMSIF